MHDDVYQMYLDEIAAIAMEQIEAGAEVLDVNVGLPGIDGGISAIHC